MTDNEFEALVQALQLDRSDETVEQLREIIRDTE